MKLRFDASRKTRGASAVEFALIAPIFLLIVLFMVDAGRILFINVTLQNAAAQGARASAIGLSPAQVATAARAAAPGVVTMAGSGDTQVAVVVNTPCPVPLNPNAVQITDVTTSITYAWTTPLALIQNITPGQTRPGTMTLSAKSGWLCGP